ncbi:cilia- and flagella-associated protein 74-like [Actinia tenebrosa]|uniref:Cilia- and flagella-associated protein 74-like n=1 Tax=Actinia tenebrosa TaxID=6105 RepID=A0A6P8IYB0_ACTTE|nr:cilia- and flagella-associated protein 74-like [Actinia tenebrosa]
MSDKIPVKTFKEEDVVIGSDDYEAAHLSLLRSHQNEFTRYVIPCFIAPGRCTDPGTLSCSVHNTLYLEVHCPAVKPSIVVISDSGRNVLEFGNISLGQSQLRNVTIQNVSNETLDLSSSLLDPHGPFQMLNALRTLDPQAAHTVVLGFEPNAPKEFNEELEIRCPRNTVSIRLKGKGVTPVISLSVPDGLLDIGDAMVSDSVTSTFKISNTSELSISFKLKLDSQSPLRHGKAQVTPRYLKAFDDSAETQPHVVGPSNYNGIAVIDCVPAQGVIGAGESKEISVTFSPDHPSIHYADVMTVEINNGDQAQTIKLEGRAWPTLVYVRGFDELMPNIESLVPEREPEEEEEAKATMKNVLLTFKSCSSPEGFGVAERILDIGCIKSNLQTKKSSDFYFENPKEANEKGFTFDPMKAGVDIGVKRSVLCKWQPPAGHDPNTPVVSSTVLTIKADITTQYKILLQGFVTTMPQAPADQQPAPSKEGK